MHEVTVRTIVTDAGLDADVLLARFADDAVPLVEVRPSAQNDGDPSLARQIVLDAWYW
jgi:hypothetical protein